MSESMRVRRCAVLMIEPRERLELDVAGLFGGAQALKATCRWIALAPHLDAEIEIDEAELAALGRLGETPWQEYAALAGAMPPGVLDSLLEKGLAIGDSPRYADARMRDEKVRACYWKPLSAVAHTFSRWSEAGVDDDVRITPHRTLVDLIREYGLPPAHLAERAAASERIGLPASDGSALDALFRRRATCRNFDTQAPLDFSVFGDMMKRVFGCHAATELAPGAVALKKSNPSGGSLHPLEAYLLVRRVENLEPGLYHYHVTDHALEPVAMLQPAEAEVNARRFVANQDFFADAPVQIALVARFRRTFWKYRNHPKAYRAIVLEAGHVSQNLYLAATELGLGAYVTAAINEIDIENAFALDALQESPIAVCGFGARAARRSMVELDPLEAVWDADGVRR
jgi:putative peptide maturation dehydrogenase